MTDPNGPNQTGPHPYTSQEPNQGPYPNPPAPAAAAPQQYWQPAPAGSWQQTEQAPVYQQPYPAEHPAQPPSGAARTSTRRKVLTAAGAGVPVLGAAAYLASRLGSHPASVTAGGSGYEPGDYNPSSLPSAAGAVNGISTSMVQSMLSKANKALASKEPDGYVSLFTGTPAKQAPITFANLMKFDFSFAQFQLIDSVTRQFDTGDGASMQIDVAFTHQLSGVDAGQVAEWYRWTVTRDGSGSPVVSKVTGSPSISGSLKYTYYPMPWDSPTDIEVAKQGSTVVCAEAPHAASVKQFLSTIATAVADNRHEWASGGGSMAGVAPGALIMLGPADQLYYWFSGAANKAGYEAGLTTPVINPAWLPENTDAQYRFTAARIALNLDTEFFTVNAGSNSVRSLAKHEDTHNFMFTLETVAEDTIPLWVVEGLADFMASHDFPNAVQAYFRDDNIRAYAAGYQGNRWDGSIPNNDEVYSSNNLVGSASYGLATMIFYYVHSRWGMAGVVKLASANYRAAAASDGSQGRDDVGGAIQSALGVSQDELTSGWLGFLKAQLGVSA